MSRDELKELVYLLIDLLTDINDVGIHTQTTQSLLNLQNVSYEMYWNVLNSFYYNVWNSIYYNV